ncbi:MAG: hypothetical protein IT531_02630 [Burkholderiales bacterium]|nr:hypothetical protein [Burkholderiales bacterium]
MRSIRAVGRVSLALLALAAAVASGAEFRSTIDPATVLYDAPSSRSKPMFVLGRGYPMEVMVALEGWTKVRDSAGTIGWVEARALSSKRLVVVKPSVVEARSAPEEGAGVAFKAGQGVLLDWLETLPSGWTRVRHDEGGQGFVRTADLWGT